jgi:aldehyde:ferredoxin oxidoreductase
MAATKTTTLETFAPTYGWRNRILRIDLSNARIWAQETAPYIPDYIGARGLAAKVLWDEYPEPVDAFAPENPLMIFPGALTGTRSPYSGRTNLCTFGPQGHPYTWFTRASIGASWGHELKRAGYDGIVITGASETPVRVLIQDDKVSLLPADGLWGKDALQTQEEIEAADGKGVKTLTIGAAGENLSRIATIHTGSTSVAGQGGFGAVMGSKRLKAITVAGSSDVPVADPARLKSLFGDVVKAVRGLRGMRNRVARINERLQKEGGGEARAVPCTIYCVTPCRTEIRNAQGRHFDQKWSGVVGCVSGLFGGGRGTLYDWDLGIHGTLELNMHANRLGLNHWDILVGIVPWLRTCQAQGLIDDFNGQPMDWNAPDFWVTLLDAIAYRQGMGNALAEGGYRAAHQLGLGEEIVRRYYTGWGYSGHWDGHAAFVNHIVYPFWIVSAIHWAMDTRDPASSTHGYIQNVMHRGPFGRGSNPDAPITWDHMRAIGERVYGRADTLDPLSGYEGKARPAAFHGVRSVIKDCLATDDQVFPLIYTTNTEDRFIRVGDIEGPDTEAHLFAAGTGTDWDPAAFSRAAERVLNLERAITVRHYGRDRAMDERVLPSFEYDENWVNPELGERKALEREKFDPVMDEYLRLRGWDVATGWPTREKLAELGMEEVHAPMIRGAREAKARLPELPPVAPVHDVHRNDPDRKQGTE